jgi:hypothetical protein
LALPRESFIKPSEIYAGGRQPKVHGLLYEDPNWTPEKSGGKDAKKNYRSH